MVNSPLKQKLEVFQKWRGDREQTVKFMVLDVFSLDL